MIQSKKKLNKMISTRAKRSALKKILPLEKENYDIICYNDDEIGSIKEYSNESTEQNSQPDEVRIINDTTPGKTTYNNNFIITPQSLYNFDNENNEVDLNDEQVIQQNNKEIIQ